MYLFFDTETTGLPNYKLPIKDPSQPHICQLGAILADEHGHIKQELNAIIKPDGWTISPETAAIHGISQEDAEKYGIPFDLAEEVFFTIMQMANTIIAHNSDFDKRMIERDSTFGEGFFTSDLHWFCTMNASKPVVKSPLTEKQQKAGYKGYKSPNLQETFTHFFGKPFEGAHDAMADVRACRDVFFKLKELAA